MFIFCANLHMIFQINKISNAYLEQICNLSKIHRKIHLIFHGVNELAIPPHNRIHATMIAFLMFLFKV